MGWFWKLGGFHSAMLESASPRLKMRTVTRIDSDP